MATSMVSQLRELASSGEVPVTDVLRKALINAARLKIEDFREWIENELHGYNGMPVPQYRIIHGGPTLMQIYTRHSQPIQFESDTVRLRYAPMPIVQPVSESQHLLARSFKELAVDYSAEIQNVMNQGCEQNGTSIMRNIM